MKYFDPWYDDDDRKRKVFSKTRPDMASYEDHIGVSAIELSRLTPEWNKAVLGQIDTMFQAAQNDFPNYLDVKLPVDLKWVSAFDAYYTPDNIHDLIDRSDPAEKGNDYVVVAIEFGVVLGMVMRSLEPRLEWIPEWPYWESSLWDKNTGTNLPVCHWAIKKLSEYGHDDGFEEKVQVTVQMLNDKNLRTL